MILYCYCKVKYRARSPIVLPLAELKVPQKHVYLFKSHLKICVVFARRFWYNSRHKVFYCKTHTEPAKHSLNMQEPDISILLLTWNRAPMLEICLKAMFEALTPDLNQEIILMDNGSTDETPDILAQYKDIPNVTIVRNASNLGIAGYKKLFSMAKGRIMIEVDDDVIEFPQKFDTTLRDYLDAFQDYGYIALNVVQNDLTTGAKPDQSCYSDDKRGDKIIEEGPTGGWCAAFRRKHYRIFKPLINILNMSMARSEDGILMACMQKILRKRLGLVKNAVCLHAVGPKYARRFGLIQREKEKYKIGGLPEMSNEYNTSM